MSGAFCFVGVFSFFINALMLTVPLYMLQIYDRVLTSRSEETLIMLTVVAAGLLLTVGLLEFVRSRVLIGVGARIDQKLNGDLFSSLVDDRLAGKSGGGGQPLRDLDAIRSFLTGPGLLSFFDSPWVPLFVAFIFLLHPLLGFIALGSAIVLFFLALLGEFASRRPSREASRASIASDSFVESSSRNAEVIRALGMLPGIRNRWLEWHASAIAHQARASNRAAYIGATAKFLRLLVQVTMLGTGAYLAIEQIITPGVMIAASIILARALAPVEAALSGWRSFITARLAYSRVTDLLAAHPSSAEPMPLPKPVGQIRVKGVVAAPPGVQKPILQGIDFGLDPGEVLGVIGPSAVGKSLIAKLLVGIWPPLSGHVRIDGVEISKWDREDVGPHIGYLPQDVELFDGTVAENIARFGVADSNATVLAARRARVHDMVLQLPHGYDTVIGTGGVVLSGGQRQRIALARALYGDPSFVVLDEPNSNLDSDGDEALRGAIETLRAMNKTVVIVSHRVSALACVDKVLVLRDGRMDALITRQELMARLARPTTSFVPAPKEDSEPETVSEPGGSSESGNGSLTSPVSASEGNYKLKRSSRTSPRSLTSLVPASGKGPHRVNWSTVKPNSEPQSESEGHRHRRSGAAG